ncbi:beta-lactamase [Pseudidiomarina atlantica]|uniref:Beta-lactamase n=1 Tax=Pseudidiomarina atlantica TaxID=1517416 RepID=A0A094J9K0_9GAMM|nr:BlaI/MecI/CopY family transcriptional regulator [Pseudidiomarina atlantica]KFZ29256.1 beta-lactamase [Pseudidiomarina atlantica]
MIEISNAELAVMKVLWHEAPLPAADIVTRLQQTQDWQAKTIKTLLNRLVQKGALSFEQQGRAYLYQPTIAESDYQLHAGQSFVQRLFAGKVTPLVATFAAAEQLSKDDIAELKALVAQLEQEQNDV